MADSLRERRAASFSQVADEYARSRPGYPDRAVQWLVPGTKSQVLELGSGTGKLTASLAAEGHRIVATDPSRPMLDQLVRELPVEAVETRAERLPFRSGTFDVAVAAQAYHWFDAEVALPEIARVLREDGELALIWNLRDESIPWVRELSEIIGSEDSACSLLDDGPLADSPLFGPLRHEDFGHWQALDLDALLGLVESRSYVATLSGEKRAAVLDEVRELYARHVRGSEGLQMRYVTSCFRTQVDRSSLPPDPPDAGGLLVDLR